MLRAMSNGGKSGTAPGAPKGSCADAIGPSQTLAVTDASAIVAESPRIAARPGMAARHRPPASDFVFRFIGLFPRCPWSQTRAFWLQGSRRPRVKFPSDTAPFLFHSE